MFKFCFIYHNYASTTLKEKYNSTTDTILKTNDPTVMYHRPCPSILHLKLQRLKAISTKAWCVQFKIIPRSYKDNSWQTETQNHRYTLHNVTHHTLPVMPMCPNQIKGRHNCLLSACTTYAFISRKMKNIMTTLLMFSRRKYARKLPATSLLDHFVMTTSKTPVIHKQQVLLQLLS